MSYLATVVNVMIASPGDVARLRAIAVDVVHGWNVIHAESRRIVLMPVTWELGASPAMGGRAQEIINNQLLRRADLLIGIFWTRAGTPTGAATSGTIEEIQEHVSDGKPAMLYFSSEPVAPAALDQEQYGRVRNFRESSRANGLVIDFDSETDFREKLSRQLAQTVIREAVRWEPSAAPSASPSAEISSPSAERWPLTADDRDTLAGLGPDETELLRAIAADSNGVVLVTDVMGGSSVEVGDRNFIEPANDARSRARWRRAVRELTNRGLLDQRDSDGYLYEITDEGYRVVELLDRVAGTPSG